MESHGGLSDISESVCLDKSRTGSFLSLSCKATLLLFPQLFDDKQLPFTCDQHLCRQTKARRRAALYEYRQSHRCETSEYCDSFLYSFDIAAADYDIVYRRIFFSVIFLRARHRTEHTGSIDSYQSHSTKLSNTVGLTEELHFNRSIMIACVSSPPDAAPVSNRHIARSRAWHGHRVWAPWLSAFTDRRFKVPCVLLFSFQSARKVPDIECQDALLISLW